MQIPSVVTMVGDGEEEEQRRFFTGNTPPAKSTGEITKTSRRAASKGLLSTVGWKSPVWPEMILSTVGKAL